jgi:hypothetical protein
MRIDEIASARDPFARQAWKDAYAGLRTADEARARDVPVRWNVKDCFGDKFAAKAQKVPKPASR